MFSYVIYYITSFKTISKVWHPKVANNHWVKKSRVAKNTRRKSIDYMTKNTNKKFKNFMYNYKDVIALGLNFEMNWQIT
jgi:hypothetical protein